MNIVVRIIIMIVLILCTTNMQAMSYGPVYLNEQDLWAPNDNPAFPYPYIYPQYYDDFAHLQPLLCKKQRAYFEKCRAEQTKIFSRAPE